MCQHGLQLQPAVIISIGYVESIRDAMTPITVFESRRSDAEAVSLRAAVAVRVPFRHPFAPFPSCAFGPCMILVERRQPNHNIGASGPAFAGPFASHPDRASNAAKGTRIL